MTGDSDDNASRYETGLSLPTTVCEEWKLPVRSSQDLDGVRERVVAGLVTADENLWGAAPLWQAIFKLFTCPRISAPVPPSASQDMDRSDMGYHILLHHRLVGYALLQMLRITKSILPQLEGASLLCSRGHFYLTFEHSAFGLGSMVKAQRKLFRNSNKLLILSCCHGKRYLPFDPAMDDCDLPTDPTYIRESAQYLPQPATEKARKPTVDATKSALPRLPPSHSAQVVELSSRSSTSSSSKPICAICRTQSKVMQLLQCTSCRRYKHRRCDHATNDDPVRDWRCQPCRSQKEPKRLKIVLKSNPRALVDRDPPALLKKIQTAQSTPQESTTSLHDISHTPGTGRKIPPTMPNERTSSATDTIKPTTAVDEGPRRVSKIVFKATKSRSEEPCLTENAKTNTTPSKSVANKSGPPDLSYGTLATMALIQAPEHQLSSQAIRKWVADNVRGYEMNDTKLNSGISNWLSIHSRGETAQVRRSGGPPAAGPSLYTLIPGRAKPQYKIPWDATKWGKDAQPASDAETRVQDEVEAETPRAASFANDPSSQGIEGARLKVGTHASAHSTGTPSSKKRKRDRQTSLVGDADAITPRVARTSSQHTSATIETADHESLDASSPASPRIKDLPARRKQRRTVLGKALDTGIVTLPDSVASTDDRPLADVKHPPDVVATKLAAAELGFSLVRTSFQQAPSVLAAPGSTLSSAIPTTTSKTYTEPPAPQTTSTQVDAMPLSISKQPLPSQRQTPRDHDHDQQPGTGDKEPKFGAVMHESPADAPATFRETSAAEDMIGGDPIQRPSGHPPMAVHPKEVNMSDCNSATVKHVDPSLMDLLTSRDANRSKVTVERLAEIRAQTFQAMKSVRKPHSHTLAPLVVPLADIKNRPSRKFALKTGQHISRKGHHVAVSYVQGWANALVRPPPRSGCNNSSGSNSQRNDTEYGAADIDFENSQPKQYDDLWSLVEAPARVEPMIRYGELAFTDVTETMTKRTGRPSRRRKVYDVGERALKASK